MSKWWLQDQLDRALLIADPETALASIPTEKRYMAAEYLREVLDPVKLRKISSDVFRIFQHTNADIVVARGLSGTLVASAMGAMFGAPFAIVRKPDESNHSSAELELSTDRGDSFESRKYKDWLIVDDFIVSGRTVEHIAQVMRNNYWLITGECKGIVLYRSTSDDTQREIKALDETVPIYRVNNNGK